MDLDAEVGDAGAEGSLAAGDFSAWIESLQQALRGERDSDVPCDGCTACCRSSQFVHIEPDETDTLAHIPAELLFPAPRAPRGHVLLGYDERGHCPMLVGGACSIYVHRPRTCRTYDCRVLAATGIDAGDEKAEIGARARRWRFGFPGPDDRARHDAVRAATGFLRDHRDELGDAVPVNPTQLAVTATRVHELFLTEPGPAVDVVLAELGRRRPRAEG